jgi:hypothetical protein
MDLAGYTGGAARRPLLPLADDARGELQATLQAEGLL